MDVLTTQTNTGLAGSSSRGERQTARKSSGSYGPSDTARNPSAGGGGAANSGTDKVVALHCSSLGTPVMMVAVEETVRRADVCVALCVTQEPPSGYSQERLVLAV